MQLKNEEGNPLADIRVNNSYVVGPGSTDLSGKPYEVVNDAEIIDGPIWLVTWIQGQHQHAAADGPPAEVDGGALLCSLEEHFT